MVEVDGGQSNGEEFKIDTVPVRIILGDSGTLIVDTYALYIDGELVRTMSVPERFVLFDLELEVGMHDATLRGIPAPDQIGTYGIVFLEDVTNVGGDLVANVERHFTFTVVPPET